MPLFVYYKANNTLGYGMAIQWEPKVDGLGKPVNKNIFQHHDIDDGEAFMGLAWLSKTYKVRCRVKAKTCICDRQPCIEANHCFGGQVNALIVD